MSSACPGATWIGVTEVVPEGLRGKIPQGSETPGDEHGVCQPRRLGKLRNGVLEQVMLPPVLFNSLDNTQGEGRRPPEHPSLQRWPILASLRQFLPKQVW